MQEILNKIKNLFKFTVTCYYSSGDSFNTYDTATTLEFVYDSYDKAKMTVDRILEHYKWYYKVEHGYWFRDKKKPKPPSWLQDPESHHQINLQTNGGTEVKIRAPWCGYFESLQEVEINHSPINFRETRFKVTYD